MTKALGAGPQTGDHLNPNDGGVAATPLPSISLPGSQNPSILYQHIHEIANKRISTLDYFRKACVTRLFLITVAVSILNFLLHGTDLSSYEGGVFWFNTVYFPRPDLSTLPALSATKLSRRATNYLLLGLSIPTVLDVHFPQSNSKPSATANASAAFDFLRSLNALLGEFDTYQQNHPPEGGTASSLSRARIPHMFKRATQSTTSRNKRTASNSGPEIGLPLQHVNSLSHSADTHHHQQHHHHHASASQSSSGPSNDSIHHSISSTTGFSITAPSPPPVSASLPTSSFTSFPHPSSASLDLPNATLSPSEGPYHYLLTPPLPFIPDFCTVFATLCDILIDTYQRILAFINSPAVCSSGLTNGHDSHGHGHGLGHGHVGTSGGGGSSGSGSNNSPGLGEMFAKADARMRKVIVGGLVKEFEGFARDGSKRELQGVQRVMLGGLMG
jgi:hypothetical protein